MLEIMGDDVMRHTCMLLPNMVSCRQNCEREYTTYHVEIGTVALSF